jgi:hypothetical protein
MDDYREMCNEKSGRELASFSRVSDYHSGGYEESYLQGYNAV